MGYALALDSMLSRHTRHGCEFDGKLFGQGNQVSRFQVDHVSTISPPGTVVPGCWFRISHCTFSAHGLRLNSAAIRNFFNELKLCFVLGG